MSTTTEKSGTGTGEDPPTEGSSSDEEQASGLGAWWKRRSPFTRRTGVVLFTVFSLFVIAAAGLFYAATKVPLPNSVDTEQVSTVTYRDGKTQIVKIGSVNRTDVPLDAVSVDARNAVLAAENRNFYSESGISFRGTLRAAWTNIKGGEVAQGGSTITQQYARNAYLTQARTFSRKMREIALAIKLDRKYSKDQILEFYLNTIYFGRGAYGIEAASRAYFGTSAKRLTAEQGAVLAGLIRAPSELDPRQDPEGADARFREVLNTMVQQGWLDPDRAARAKLPTTLAQKTDGANTPKTPQDAYIREAVTRELTAAGISEDQITRGGLQITTTLDPKMQQAAVNAVDNVLGGAPADLQTALVAVQPGSGDVLAWYGGKTFGKDPSNGYEDYVDNVTYPVQPGSSFKPIALAAALQKGTSLNSSYNGNDHSVVVPGYPSGVPNYGGESFGSVNLPTATAHSVNSVFVKLGFDTGESNVAKMGHALGIPAGTNLPEVSSLPLGVADVKPIDMANVYATFASQGETATAHLVDKAVDRDGNVVYSAPGRKSRALSQSASADLTYALQQPLQRGTAAGLDPGRPAAGKTGTTDQNLSAWFCGYTPQLAAAVALFRPQRKPLNGILGLNEVTGGTLPGRVWQNFMENALSGQPVIPFPKASFNGSTQGQAVPAPRPTRTYQTYIPRSTFSPPPPTGTTPSPRTTTVRPSPSATRPQPRPSSSPIVRVPGTGGGGNGTGG
ncbi:MAG TPA: transglycosylase domain-containing protein [Frankiaceae bacterium]|nr:transglycosylase domain-containing protein [Frankiaceae bacterium]